MTGLTKEERESRNKHIKSISTRMFPLSVLEDIKAEIKRASVGKWYIGNVNGKSEEVIPLIDALEIIDSHIKAGDKE